MLNETNVQFTLLLYSLCMVEHLLCWFIFLSCINKPAGLLTLRQQQCLVRMGLGPGRTCWVAISATVTSLACNPLRLNPVGSVQLATPRTGGWPMISVSISTSSQWSPKSIHLDSSISAVSWVGGRAFGCWLRWREIATVSKAAEGGGLGHGAGGQPELLLGREPCSPLDVPPSPTSSQGGELPPVP